MKNIRTLLIVSSLLASLGVAAQPAELVTGDEERNAYQNKSYLLVKSLTLKPGFVFTATSTTSFYAKVHPSAVQSVTPSTDQNFVRTESILVSGVTTEAQVKSTGISSKGTAYHYSDGLGRSLQTVSVSGSPALNDVIQPAYYDALGRPARTYLPYVAGSGSQGAFRVNALADQGTFYNSPPSKVQSDTRPFAETTFDDSPLGRIKQTEAPGAAWDNVPATNSIRMNGMGSIRLWTVSGGLPTSTSTYLPGELIITEVKDEETTTSKTYTDFLGRVVLKEAQATGGLWASTYYVYNDYGNLLFIIPPAAASNLTPDGTFADRWFYQYEYDDYQRQTGSKAPGAGWVYTVYDKWDRTVLTQDANQRAKATPEWSFVKYDDLNRPVMTGLLATTAARTTLVSEFASVADTKRFETRDASSVGYTLNQASTTSTTITEANLLTISYFDNYSFTGNTGWDGESNSFSFMAESGYTGSQFNSVLDLATGSKVKILNSSPAVWLNSVTYYDNSYRPLQTISENHFGKLDRITTEYDFSGKVLKTKRVHNNALPQTISIQERYTYDVGGRLLSTYHQVNTQPEVLLSSFSYNELGQLVDKKLHSADNGSSWLQSLDYRYNIRGWNTNMNFATNDAGDPVDYFGMEFGYQNSLSGNTTRYDGLITSTRWRHDLTTKDRIYNYTYDKGALTAATYKVNGATNPQTGIYNESNLTYDQNGNIQTLNRSAGSLSSNTVDQLTYNYGTNGGNQLMKVTDGASSGVKAQLFNDGNTSGDDYVYDLNGNLVKDLNKGIKTPANGNGIVYNFMDLPERINFSNGNYILITYDAIGTKLSQIFYTSAGVQQGRLDYSGEFVYSNGSPQVIFHSEGRLVAASNTNLITDVTTREANSFTGFSANGSVSRSTQTIGTPEQTYVKFTCLQTGGTPGAYPIGSSIAVNTGETYTFKVLGYQSAGTNASLYVASAAGANLVWPGTPLKIGASAEDWVSVSFTVPSGVTQVQLGVLWSTGVSGNVFYINRVALYKSDWEYQYFLNDHLGSPRVVLQTAPTTLIHSATMESGNYANEDERFLNLNITKEISFAPANATVGGSYAYVLNSSTHVGPGKSFSVLPGDVIQASTMAYYATGGSYTKTAVGSMATYVASALSGGVAGSIDAVATSSYGTLNGSSAAFALSPDQGSTRPSAFINYILFDETYTPIEAKSTPVGSAGGVLHQVTLPTINITQTGYLYVYLSYDNNAGQDVYFDEFSINYQESPVTQINSYYPFGLTAFSWMRSGEYENKYLYQGKELVSETGWQDFGSRFYYNDLGRWFSTDPKSQFGSPYLAMGNNPVMGVDPDGQYVSILAGAVVGGVINLFGQALQGNVHNFREGLAAFGMGALAGGVAAATGGASLTGDQLLLQSVVGQIPGANMNLGNGFSLSVSPALMMGTQGMRFGANLGATYSRGDFSVGLSTGAAFERNSITGANRWNGKLGGGVTFDNGKFYGSLSTMKYWSGETSQRTGTVGLGAHGFAFDYENDFQILGLTKIGHISDGGDRYRTAAARLSYQDISIGFNLFTGDPNLKMADRDGSIIDGHLTYTTGNSDKYRLGAVYFGYKNVKIGANSEWWRHQIQNRFAHDFLRGSDYWFKVMNHNPATLYGNVGMFSQFSLW